MKLRPQNVRTRLTIWYVAILAAGLLIYGAATSAVVFFQLRGQMDRLAIEDLETVEGFLTFGANGKIFLRNGYHDHPYPARMQERLMEVWGADGTLLYRNDVLGNRALGGPPAPGEGVNSYSQRSIAVWQTGLPCAWSASGTRLKDGRQSSAWGLASGPCGIAFGNS